MYHLQTAPRVHGKRRKAPLPVPESSGLSHETITFSFEAPGRKARAARLSLDLQPFPMWTQAVSAWGGGASVHPKMHPLVFHPGQLPHLHHRSYGTADAHHMPFHITSTGQILQGKEGSESQSLSIELSVSWRMASFNYVQKSCPLSLALSNLKFSIKRLKRSSGRISMELTAGLFLAAVTIMSWSVGSTTTAWPFLAQRIVPRKKEYTTLWWL